MGLKFRALSIEPKISPKFRIFIELQRFLVLRKNHENRDFEIFEISKFHVGEIKKVSKHKFQKHKNV